MQTIKRVMVLCTGNICRSPMAAAVLHDGLLRAGRSVTVESAGLGALDGHPADELAIQLMQERGLDIRDHSSRQFMPTRGLECDLILVMDAEQRVFMEESWPLLHGRIYRWCHWENTNVDDPFQRGERAFRKALEKIDTGLESWLAVFAG